MGVIIITEFSFERISIKNLFDFEHTLWSSNSVLECGYSLQFINRSCFILLWLIHDLERWCQQKTRCTYIIGKSKTMHFDIGNKKNKDKLRISNHSSRSQPISAKVTSWICDKTGRLIWCTRSQNSVTYTEPKIAPVSLSITAMSFLSQNNAAINLLNREARKCSSGKWPV